jgi:putative oxidoreductase
VLQRIVRLVLAPRVSGPFGWAMAAARVAAGVVFVSFSFGKFVNHQEEAAAFDRYGIPFPDQVTYLVGTLEVVGGLLLVFGLGTRLAALALAGNVVGAIATAGRLDGGPVNLGLAPVLLAVMLVLVWTGAGRWSVDGVLAAPGPREGRLNGFAFSPRLGFRGRTREDSG